MAKTIRKTSSLRRKQRKNLYNASLHVKQKGVSAHLSEELSGKIGRRAVPLRKGDKVKVMRGDDKGSIGKIDRIELKDARIFIEGLATSKANGAKVQKPFKASNLIIIELATGDKRRFSGQKAEAKTEVKEELKKEGV